MFISRLKVTMYPSRAGRQENLDKFPARSGVRQPLSWLAPGLEDELVRERLAVRAGGQGRAWIIWLPRGIAFAGAGLLALADGYAAVMGSWDTPAPGLGWLGVGAAGQGVLAAGTVVVLVQGLKRPRSRRAAAVSAWVIVAAEVGWFGLTAALAGGS